MERRGFLTWAAVGLVAVVALLAFADALRDVGTSTHEVADTVATDPSATSTEPKRLADAPEDWPAGTLDGVLTFVDAEDCTIRSIDLSSGREQPVDRYETACGGFWAPRVTARVAFVQPFEDGGAVRFVDLSPEGGGELGSFTGTGDIHWSPDGERAAWCTARRSEFRPSGIEIGFPGEAQAVPLCPVAYTADGGLAYSQGNRLMVGGRAVARARTPIGTAEFAPDGSVVVVDFPGRIYRTGDPTIQADPVPGRTGQRPVFSPDLCLVVVPRVLGLTEIDLCSGQTVYRELPGIAAAWSPDGLWLAVAVPGEIQFYPARSTLASRFSLPMGALALAWRPS